MVVNTICFAVPAVVLHAVVVLSHILVLLFSYTFCTCCCLYLFYVVVHYFYLLHLFFSAERRCMLLSAAFFLFALHVPCCSIPSFLRTLIGGRVPPFPLFCR